MKEQNYKKNIIGMHDVTSGIPLDKLQQGDFIYESREAVENTLSHFAESVRNEVDSMQKHR